MKDACKSNLTNTSVIYYQNISVVSGKVMGLRKFIFTAVKTDLPKAFDCIPHNLRIAKLSAYGFDRKPLIFILAYLKSKIRSAFTDYLNILFGVSNGPF